jgi:hypothetical protein
MAEDRMAVLDMLRKATADGNVDVLREGVRVLAEAIMEAEVSELTGLPKGERAPERRLTSRNGSSGCSKMLRMVVQASGAPVIALALGARGMPATIDDRLTVVRQLVAVIRAAGIADDRIYVDPIVMTIATNTESAMIALETIRRVRAEFPEAHITSGLSNVSFGLPARGLVSRTYLSLAVSAGLDTAILDPLDRELRAALLATELLLGRDRHCLTYTRAFRAGLLEVGPAVKAPA